MKFLSVCSGIEAASVALNPLGFESFGFSEIEKFPCELLKHHYPKTPNFGDMTKFKEWPNESIELLCGGTPCQSFSVAGLRKGLDDPRGNLMLTFGSIADKYRPTWLVWENVTGVLSSNGGKDFGAFLGMLAELGYGFAYRVLDAQYFGLAQRRKRVFLIGHIGSWQRAAAVLFERESLCWNLAPSREKGKGYSQVAGTLTANGGGLNRPAGNGNELDFCIPQISHCLTTKSSQRYDYETETMIPVSFHVDAQPDQMSFSNETVGTLTASQHAGVFEKHGVRRLMPIECERLMGFPDNYTQLGNTKDAPRYKALGNSWAVPVVRWIGERINMVNAI